MTIKERTIDAVKQLLAIQEQEAAIKAKRIALEEAITAIAVEDYREYSDPDNPKSGVGLDLGETNYIDINGTVYKLEFKDNLEFHSLHESSATHF